LQGFGQTAFTADIDAVFLLSDDILIFLNLLRRKTSFPAFKMQKSLLEKTAFCY
jgi:hypothetical protein